MSMSPAQLSALVSLQQNDYATVAVLTAVAYDYVLTFPYEIKYIWSKPWSWVSTLFIFVRYLGVLNLITCSLLGSSFLPGPAKVCEIVYIIDAWVFNLFLGAADCMMMLRVWAMYNRSKPLLRILLTLFFLEIIFSVIGTAINSNPKNVSAPIVKIMDDSFCLVISTPVWTNEATIFQITHGAAMCLLAIIRFVRQSLQMYRATKQWQPNRYMSLLVTQGIFYFFAIFLYSLMNMLSDFGKFPTGGWQMILLIILNYIWRGH
ncbi:hypothetical protein V8E55_003462 [Tylopilus felleus]